jgi:hypothetical protein
MSDSTDTVWSTPPTQPVSMKHADFWESLQKNPGKWGVYPGTNRNSTQVNRRELSEGRYEAVVRGGLMYVRWLNK